MGRPREHRRVPEKGLPPRRKGTAAAGAEGRERPVGDTGPYLAAAITMATAGS